MIYRRDAIFQNFISELYAAKSKREFTSKFKEIESYLFSQNPMNVFNFYRLALESNKINVSIKKIQNAIIDCGSPEIIYRFARDVQKSSIPKLEQALINLDDIYVIARFGAFIKNASTDLIQKIILQKENAKAAYIYLKYVNGCDIDRLKHIIFKSKRPRYLFELTKFLSKRNDLELVQSLILNSKSNLYIRLFAKHYPNKIDVYACENKIILSKDISEMMKFGRDVDQAFKIKKLTSLF